jgi:adenosylhomocysteine nucleosidase
MSVPSEKKALNDEFGAIACEMEGGAIGHVCYINGVPFGILRAISDGEGAEMDYATFAEKAANQSIEIMKNFVKIFEV